MNRMMTPNVDITLVIRKYADGRMAVSVLPKSGTLKNEAQNNIVPLALNGTPEELDAGFLRAVARPVQKVSGLITNMAQFEAQADKAASSGKGAKGSKNTESKEDKEKREKYERNLKKADELIEARKHKEAADALTEARKYAKPDDLKNIDSRIEEQKKLANQGDLFAMMDEPVQQPVSQPVAAEQLAQPVEQVTAEPVIQQTQPAPPPQPQPAQDRTATLRQSRTGISAASAWMAAISAVSQRRSLRTVRATAAGRDDASGIRRISAERTSGLSSQACTIRA